MSCTYNYTLCNIMEIFKSEQPNVIRKVAQNTLSHMQSSPAARVIVVRDKIQKVKVANHTSPRYR